MPEDFGEYYCNVQDGTGVTEKSRNVTVKSRCHGIILFELALLGWHIQPSVQEFAGSIAACSNFFSLTRVAAHLRSFFEKVGSLPRVFIVYICAHTFPR